MKLCVVGTGYVGLVSGSCLADAGNIVTCVDIDEEKVARLNRGVIPIYEPGLEDVIRRNEAEGRLYYTTDYSAGLEDADICFITVDTPPDGTGRADLKNVLAVAEKLGQLIDHPMIVVTKSTVPVGTTIKVKSVISEQILKRGLNPSELISVASNPEFLKEGSAVEDFMKPNRVIVGVEDLEVGKKLHELYAPFMRRSDRFLVMGVQSAELAKYAANSMLATRISFMNEMARLCEKVGADIGDIKSALGSDPRIGPDFLYAGLGFGGSCFPKDTRAIIELGKEHDAHLGILHAVHGANEMQREWFWKKVHSYFEGRGGVASKNFAIWGLSFKANTDDVRYAPSLYLIGKLLEAGARVRAYDPIAHDNSRLAMSERAHHVGWTECAYDAIEGADALIICTEWLEFRSPDFARMRKVMKSPVVFDGRNLYDPASMRKAGFIYTSVGRC